MSFSSGQTSSRQLVSTTLMDKPANAFESSVKGQPWHKLDISSLMSPPEPVPFDSFAPQTPATPVTPAHRNATPAPPVGHAPISPPVSPLTRVSIAVEPTPVVLPPIKDPILYPTGEALPERQPLFGTPPRQIDTQRIVDEHVASRPSTLFQNTSPPARKDYDVTLYFFSTVMNEFTRNPKGWLSKQREQLRADQRARASRNQQLRKLPLIMPAQAPLNRPAGPRISKPERKVLPMAKARPPKAVRKARINAQPGNTTTTTNIAARASSTPEPRPRSIAPSREDKNFDALPDYCPPLESLPDRHNSLKVDWKGNALDLSRDPHRHLLHPDELQLASCLRLDCATYLTTKRRLFVRRLNCFKIGKDFRKTDAQQAGKIDVNKASKLWTAYDRVGWLDEKWLKPFL